MKFWTILLFPWLRRPFWKFQRQNETLHMSVTIPLKFHAVCSTLFFLEILNICAATMVTVDNSKILKAYISLPHVMLYINTVSFTLVQYSLRKCWFYAFFHRVNAKLSPSFHDNGGHFELSKYCLDILVYWRTFW